MIFYIAWVLIFSSVFIATFYLSLFSEVEGGERKDKTELKSYPELTILMPAYNEEKVVEEALESVKNLDYPNYQVNFVDDASTDSTLEKAKNYASDQIHVLEHQENKGKAGALNTALENTDSKYIVVQDADSKIDSSLLKNAVAKLNRQDGLGGVIASIKPLLKNNFVRKIQMVEYQLMNFFRMLMTEMNTLNVTPGAFSIYRTSDVKKADGFDEGNLTEDLEMAFSLRKIGKNFEMLYFNSSKTEFPPTLSALYSQRVRWARGFIYNAWKHKDMFLNPKYGYFGTFQLPMLIIMPALIVTSFFMVFYGVFQTLYSYFITITAVGFELPALGIQSLYIMFLNANLKVYIPLVLSLILVAYIIKTAYRYSGEKPKNVTALLVYFFTYFLLQSGFWVAAVLKELTRSKRLWT